MPILTQAFIFSPVRAHTHRSSIALIPQRSHRWCRQQASIAGDLLAFTDEDIEVLKVLGGTQSSSLSITARQEASASLAAAAQAFDPDLKLYQPIQSGSTIDIHFLKGRLKTGRLSGSEVILKAYPPATGSKTDLLYANEVAVHAKLQQQPLGVPIPGSERIAYLLGILTKPTGQQLLVFRNDAVRDAADYSWRAAEELFAGHKAPDENFWQQPARLQMLRRRKQFVKAVIIQILEGLAYMHMRERVHQRLIPGNVLLSSAERSEDVLVQLQDLALAVDISDSALIGGATLAEIWAQNKLERDNPLKALAEPLWARAKEAGAKSAREQQNYAIAEDILAAGLLVAHLSFVPFCSPGSIDFQAIQRLFGVAFQTEVGAAREYCQADERWQQAVKFLNEDIGAGWDLIQSMIFPDYGLRPSAEACLKHPFLALVRPPV